jgi:hypothetical protein
MHTHNYGVDSEIMRKNYYIKLNNTYDMFVFKITTPQLTFKGAETAILQKFPCFWLKCPHIRHMLVTKTATHFHFLHYISFYSSILNEKSLSSPLYPNAD